MNTYLAWVMVTVGLVGCGAQQLTGGSHDAGGGLDRPAIDVSERNLDDAGCPPEGKIACLPVGCSDVFPTPACIHGVWSCPDLGAADLSCPCGPVPAGCSCEPSVGISCPVDAGTVVAKDGGQARDGSASCPPTLVEDGGHILACAYAGCRGDTGVNAVCSGGAWTCPPGSVDTRTCPIEYCTALPPAGCTCNPANGALTCRHDAGADAPQLPVGIGG